MVICNKSITKYKSSIKLQHFFGGNESLLNGTVCYLRNGELPEFGNFLSANSRGYVSNRSTERVSLSNPHDKKQFEMTRHVCSSFVANKISFAEEALTDLRVSLLMNINED